MSYRQLLLYICLFDFFIMLSVSFIVCNWKKSKSDEKWSPESLKDDELASSNPRVKNLLFQNHCQELRSLKNQQWNVNYYVILLFAGLIGLSQMKLIVLSVEVELILTILIILSYIVYIGGLAFSNSLYSSQVGERRGIARHKYLWAKNSEKKEDVNDLIKYGRWRKDWPYLLISLFSILLSHIITMLVIRWCFRTGG